MALAAQAARAAAAAIEDVTTAGTSIIRRPGAFAYPESPAAALPIVSRFEHAARAASAAQVRRARESACPEHVKVGALMGFGELQVTVRHGRRDGSGLSAHPPEERLVTLPSIAWRSRGFRQAVAGFRAYFRLAAGPARGHADGCEHLAADVADGERRGTPQ